ncbi:MAG: DUF192 domain-containing protein [Ignavibacteria bacterium]|nr:DUF192 domain-containing protein [Ignavibacteria bacterium]
MTNSKKKKITTKEKKSFFYIISGIFIIIIIVIVYIFFLSDNKVKTTSEPKFKKQGELEFIRKDDNKVISKIDIEVADKDSSRIMGLMYRKSMDENQGMLFVFPKEEYQSFWMKNTYISLDIVYVNSEKEIVKIYKNTIPRSINSLPSEKKSQYVIEVIGGYTDKHNIKEGDKINFVITK